MTEHEHREEKSLFSRAGGGRLRAFGAAALLVLMIFAARYAGAEVFCTFRFRPGIGSADLRREDGYTYIGTSRGKQRTAELNIGTEARTPDGNPVNLHQLVAEKGGKVVQAYWRIRTREVGARGNRFALWPEGEENAASGTAENGWNLFDVTGMMQRGLEEGSFRKIRLQAGNRAARQGAEFDLEHSLIYVTLALAERPYEESEERIADNPMLDIGLSALPAEHWALKAYQELTGTLMTAQWPETGVPYYYGGHAEEKVLHRFFPLQESKYYKKDKLYLCGFDCGSFTHWIEERNGYAPHEELVVIVDEREDTFPFRGLAPRDWVRGLAPGDTLVFNHGTFHTGMYIGTPRMYGLNAENAPELAEWLDVPMMIHCGEDPFCYDRFKAYIDAHAKDWRMTTSPPDGGVTVSLIGVSIDEAPHVRTAPWGKKYGYFEVMGQKMTLFPTDDCAEIAWYRCPED